MPENYSHRVLENYRNPKNSGKLDNATHTAEELNPLCGDEIRVYLKIKDSKIENMSYEVRGCALSIASASLLSERIIGQNFREIGKIGKSDIEKLLGAKIGNARKECITLALNAIKKAVAEQS